MKSIFLYFIFLLLANSCNNSSHQNSSNNEIAQNIAFPSLAINKNSYLKGTEDTLFIQSNFITAEIRPNGFLYWGIKLADSLKLTSDMFVSRAYYYEIDTLLYLFLEESDMDCGASNVVKINIPQRKIIWKAGMNGFNLGLPYLKDNYAYVTTIGIIGKLNLMKGEYIYKFSDLYDNKKYSFNKFDTILFSENLTYFISENYSSGHLDTVIVNEESNELIIKK